ncbi:hypothetical protein Tco_0080807, partial [Tanacetum coccineum]
SRHHDAQKNRAAVRAEIEVLRRERLTMSKTVWRPVKPWLDNYDNESFDDDNDDDDVEKDKEEEEHLAPVDPPTVPTDDPIPSS